MDVDRKSGQAQWAQKRAVSTNRIGNEFEGDEFCATGVFAGDLPAVVHSLIREQLD
jgi:hypothetical protein